MRVQPRNRRARDCRSHNARAMENRRVQRDRVGQILLPHHLHKKRLADRNVERVHNTNQEGDENQFPNRDDFPERQPRQNKSENHRGGLRPHDASPPVVAIADVTANRGQKQHRHLARETENPEQRGRTSQLIY